jgi:hypothetical protein
MDNSEPLVAPKAEVTKRVIRNEESVLNQIRGVIDSIWAPHLEGIRITKKETLPNDIEVAIKISNGDGVIYGFLYSLIAKYLGTSKNQSDAILGNAVIAFINEIGYDTDWIDELCSREYEVRKEEIDTIKKVRNEALEWAVSRYDLKNGKGSAKELFIRKLCKLEPVPNLKKILLDYTIFQWSPQAYVNPEPAEDGIHKVAVGLVTYGNGAMFDIDDYMYSLVDYMGTTREEAISIMADATDKTFRKIKFYPWQYKDMAATKIGLQTVTDDLWARITEFNNSHKDTSVILEFVDLLVHSSKYSNRNIVAREEILLK